MSRPASLPENADLAFVGEPAWPPAMLEDREANRLLAAPNTCGRPNSDVLRRRLAVIGGDPVQSWQVDFPAHFTEQEAALYEQPFALLQRRSGGAWSNPHFFLALRRALARVTRWLAVPADAEAPDWRWIEDDVLPDASLVVAARDDDFTHGVLISRPFAIWWTEHGRQPVLAIESFPFPWPPSKPLSALSRAQEEARHAVARAARSGDVVALHSTVLAAYGWRDDLDDREILERLTTLSRERRGSVS